MNMVGRAGERPRDSKAILVIKLTKQILIGQP